MRTSFRLLPLLLLPTLLIGCDDGEDSDTDAGSDTEMDSDSDSDTDSDTWGTSLFGQIVDESGAGMEGVRVNLCRQVCTTTTTAADGTYSMPGLPIDRYSLHIETHGDLLNTDPSMPFDLVESDMELDVIVPATTAINLPVSAAELEIATDLLITAAAGDVTLLFEEDPTAISAARVAMADAPPVDVSGQIQAIWYLEPWSAEADGGLSLRIRDTFGGDTSANYVLWQSDYDSSEWVSLGNLTSDGSYLTGSAALTTFDTLVLVRVLAQ